MIPFRHNLTNFHILRCLECETESKTPEPFQDLLLHMKRVKELPQEQGPHFGSIGNFPDEDKDLSDDEDEDSGNQSNIVKFIC